MSERIDQMKAWWDGAEQAEPDHGDSVIERMSDDEYRVRKWFGCMGSKSPHIRILERAPKPKPAWHNAVAVIATYVDHVDQETFRGVWTPDGDGVWQHEDGVLAGADALADITPLIEQKVTEVAMDRVDDLLHALYGTSGEDAAYDVIRAALGLETE